MKNRTLKTLLGTTTATLCLFFLTSQQAQAVAPVEQQPPANEDTVSVPEPSSMAAMALVGGGLLRSKLRKGGRIEK